MHLNALDKQKCAATDALQQWAKTTAIEAPTARITAELQREGLVADGVEPALKPIYRGVKAEAFRIPVEMVTILAADQSTQPAGDT